MATVAGICLLSSVALLFAHWQSHKPNQGESATLSISDNSGPTSGGGGAMWMTDLSNPQKRMGASHNVFVAKIVKEVSRIPLDNHPQIQFEAQIIYNIKGNLKGRVIVEQQIGENNDPDTFSTLGEMKPSSTYLLITRYYAEKNRYTISAYSGGITPISDDQNLTDEQLKNLVKENERVKKLEDAYKNEIPLVADVNTGHAYNSYQSLAKDQKKALESYWAGDEKAIDAITDATVALKKSAPASQPPPEKSPEVPAGPGQDYGY